MKFYSICMVCIMCLLFPVSGFAGFGDIVKKIGRVFNPHKVSEAMLADLVFELDLRGSIRLITGEDLPETASRQEVLESFREAYIKAAVDGDYHDHYKKLIFEKWWVVDDFREVMFPALLSDDLVGKFGNPVNLIKWSREARFVGAEYKLRDFILSSFRRYGISMEDLVIQKNGVINLKPEVELEVPIDDPFLLTVFSATRSSASFTEQWKRIMNPQPGVIEQDFDVIFPNPDHN